MKTVFKHFSKKTLSLIIAFAVVICSFGTTLSTFMDFGAKAVGVEHFEVTYGSPAVPMFEKTTINLYDLRVQFTKNGEPVDGTDITWSAEAGTLAAEFLNATGKTFTALGTGVFKVTATETANTANSKTIYIIANKKDNYEFVLAKESGLNMASTYDASKWVYGVGETDSDYDPEPKGVYVSTQPTSADFKNANNSRSRILYYRSDILKDFADYTISTSMKITGINGTKPFRGIVARAQLNDAIFNTDGTLNTLATNVSIVKPGTAALYMTSFNFGGLHLRGYYMPSGSETATFTNDHRNVTYHTVDNSNSLKIVNRNPGYVLSTYSDSAIAAVTTYRNLTYKIDGNDIVYSIDGNVILDTTKSRVNVMGVIRGYDNVLGTDFNVEGKMPEGGTFDHPFTDSGTITRADINSKIDSFGADKGTVGFVVAGKTLLTLKDFKVMVNGIDGAEDMPLAEELVLETINDKDFVSTTVNTNLDLSRFIYAFVDGAHIGSAVDFAISDANASVNKTYSTISGKNFVASRAGLYAVEATYGGNKITLSVQVADTVGVNYYKVTDASPAIPMYVNTRIDIDQFAVQFENGLYYYGREITWSIDASNKNDAGIVLSDASKTLAAIEKGTYVLKATVVTDEGTLTRRVYFIANAAGDNDFYLVNLDLTVQSEGGGFNPNDWIFATGSTANNLTVVAYDSAKHFSSGVSSGYVNGHGVLIYKNEMLNDFSDYTAIYNVISRNNANTLDRKVSFITRAAVPSSVNAGGQIFTRTGDAATGFNALGLQYPSYGAPALINFTKYINAVGFFEQDGYCTTDFDNIKYSDPKSDYVLYTGATVSVKLMGSDIISAINGNVVLDTTKDTINKIAVPIKNTNGDNTWASSGNIIAQNGTISGEDFRNFIKNNANMGKGTVGVVFSRSDVAARKLTSLKVQLNDITADKIPASTEYNPYIVKSSSPALPLTAGTKVDTDDFMVQLGAFAYSASNLSYSAVTPVQNGAVANGVKIEDGEIKAYKRGVYSVVASANDGTGRTQKIYIVVKNADEDEYVIYDKDYRTDGVDVSDWTTVITDSSGNIVTSGGVYEKFEEQRVLAEDLEEYNYVPSYQYKVSSKEEKEGSTVVAKVFTYYKLKKTVSLQFSGNYATKAGVNGFVPFDNTVLTDGLSIIPGTSGEYSPVYSYTTLNNAVINDLSDYTITASVKNNVGRRGAVAIIGRVNGVLGYGFGSGSKSAYNIVGALPLDAPFVVTGTSFAAVSDVAGIKSYYYDTITNANAEYRVYSIKYSGSDMTLTAPNGSSKTVSGVGTATGKVGFSSYSKDTLGGFTATPILAEFKVSLKNIDLSSLTVSNISGFTGETTTKVPTYKEDASNIKFTLNAYKQISEWALVNANKKNPQKIVIPSTVDGEKVTAVASKAFQNVPYLGEVVFEKGIRSILDSAFLNNRYLDKITLPETLENINESAFSKNGIIDLVIPSSTLSIGKYAFNGNLNLHTLVIGSESNKNERLYMSQLTTIADYAFQDCSVLETVELPMGLKNLGANAFNKAASLKEVYFYSRTTVIGADAIPATATIYGATGSTAEAYATANGNIFVSIDSDIEAVEQAYADYLVAIEATARLKAQTVDTGATFLFYKTSTDSFGGVAGLIAANANAGKYVLPIKGSYTNDITGEMYKDFNVTYVKANAFKECDDKANIYNVVIPQGYTEIQASAFSGCTELRYITLPNTLNFIRDYAFQNNTWLKKIELPENLGEIGKGAFMSSGRLADVTFADGSTCYSLGESAFQGTAIETIKLPVHLRTIGKKAFADTPLTDVYIYNREAAIGDDAFPAGTVIHGVAGSTAQAYAKENGYTFVADVDDTWDTVINKVNPTGKFTYSVDTQGRYSVTTYSAGGKIVIPYEIDFKAEDGTITKGALVTRAGINMFKNVYYRFQVTALVVPEGITTIEDSSFHKCANLVSLTLPSTLRRVEQYAFYAADIHGELEFGINCDFIGKGAFASNKNLKAVYIYNPDCEIEDDAFVYDLNIKINEEATKEQRIKIYGVKGSTAEAYASKYDHEFVEIPASKFPTISDVKDNGNYILTGDAATNTVVGYARKDASKGYSAKVVFPAKLNGADMTTIQGSLFKLKPYTSSLVAVVIEEGYTTIGDSAFSGCERLVRVQLPSTLTEINNSAFANTALAGELVIPESVTKIGGSAFAGCTNLTSVTITNPTVIIGPNAFSAMAKSFTIRGLTGSTAEEYYTKYKKYGIKFEAIGEYVDPNAPSEEEDPGANGNNGAGDTQQNAGDVNENKITLFGVQVDDLTLIIIIGIGALMLLLLIAGVVIVIIVANSDDEDDEDDEDEDDDEYDEDDEDEDDDEYDDEDE